MTTAAETAQLIERLNSLGLTCDHVPLDEISSATAALSCFPMYMVANAGNWQHTPDNSVQLRDFFDVTALRDAYALGEQEGALDINKDHRSILRSLLTDAKPPLLVVYDHALETLEQFLALASPDLAERVRAAVARMMAAVATASGEGWFGGGGAATEEQWQCIQRVREQLALDDAPAAVAALQDVRA